jgi:hypothetical protein
MRCRPLSAPGLRLADYEAWMENLPKPYPFGLENAGSAYQDTVHHLFIDHTERNHISDPMQSTQLISISPLLWSTW